MAGTTSLSRIYRPQIFSDLVNQKHVRIPLEREIATGRIGHAYMFTGPRGVGKTTTARIFAKAINCLQRKGAEPCTCCANCTSIAEGRALDVIEMDAASHTQVDHVREHILPNARTRPSVFPYKVFIIDEVHMLSTSAFNALLKVIEEPPDYVVFIFATTDIDRVPDTIISRCQRFDFRRLQADNLLERLKDISGKEKIIVAEPVLAQVAELADGSIRDAESLLSQLLSLEEKEITEEAAALVLPRRDRTRAVALFLALSQSDPSDARAELTKAIEAGTNARHFYLDMIQVVRDLIQAAAERQGAKKELSDILSNLRPGMLSQWLRGLLELEELLHDAQIPELPLELFILEQSVYGVQAAEKPGDEPPLQSPPSTPSSTTKTLKPSEKEKEADTLRADTKKTDAPKPGTPQQRKASSSASSANLQKIWNALVLKVSEASHSLAVVLKVCRAKSMDEGVFTISAAYPFHRDQLLDHKSRTILQDALRELTGEELKVEGVVERVEYTRADDIPQRIENPVEQFAQSAPRPSSDSKKEPSTGDNTWDKVLQAFSA